MGEEDVNNVVKGGMFWMKIGRGKFWWMGLNWGFIGLCDGEGLFVVGKWGMNWDEGDVNYWWCGWEVWCMCVGKDIL